MKKINYLLLISIPLFIISCMSTVDEGTEQAESIQFYMTNLHLWDSTLNVSEVELAKILDDVNNVIAELGYPGAGYLLWKVQNDTLMQHRYMMLSSWPDRAAYDSIHNSEAWQSIWEEHSEFLEPMRSQSIYLKYDLVN